MKRLLSVSVGALLALAIAAPASAAPFAQTGSDGFDVSEAVIWSLVGMAIGCVVLGILYLFKRQIGAFPENPEWVAPIAIMLSSDLPSEEPADHGHAPAHH